MENQRNEGPQHNLSQETTKLIEELQRKYAVDSQEVLNAVIDANNDREKAEQYLRERTTNKE